MISNVHSGKGVWSFIYVAVSEFRQIKSFMRAKQKWKQKLANSGFQWEMSVIIYTIGFTKKSAEEFFEALRRCGAKHLLDIRLHNTSQLAGFTKWSNLQYLLKQIVDMEYHEVPILAPAGSFIKEYRRTGDWPTFERRYLGLLEKRQVEHYIEPVWFKDGAVLLCSEAKPDRCHRRLAAEYLVRSMLPEADIEHL